MGRPPLSLRATTLACLGSESGGGDSFRLAVMADVVGVVVSAFRFTPFFYDNKVPVNSSNKEVHKEMCHMTATPLECRLPARCQASDHMQGLVSFSAVSTVLKTPRLRGARPRAQGHTAGHGEARTLPVSPEDSVIQVGERATDLSSMRCYREFTQHLRSTTDWCQRQRLPALKTKKVPDQALSRCFKDRHKSSRRRGGRRSIPG